METKAERYRRLAREADIKASQCVEQYLKKGFEDIARQWREMADQAERQCNVFLTPREPSGM